MLHVLTYKFRLPLICMPEHVSTAPQMQNVTDCFVNIVCYGPEKKLTYRVQTQYKLPLIKKL
jgi:hypothetical protein